MRVFVSGGTGDLGRRTVERLEKAGHEVLVGTRNPTQPHHVRYELVAGAEPGTLEGTDVVVHLASDPLNPQADVEGSRTLWQQAARAGVAHVIYVSIVGIDRHPFPYYQAKLQVEHSLKASGLPYTILRATQFHGLIPRFADEFSRRLGFVPVPSGLRFQSIDPDVMADRLADLVEAAPSGRVPDLAGPEVLDARHMVRLYVQQTGKRIIRVPLPFWGKAIRAFREGQHLAPGIHSGGRTYADYVSQMPQHASDPVATSLRVISAAFIATMIWMVVSPAGFHESVTGFGDVNLHFIRDTATFVLPLAAILWIAAARRAWRVPVLVIALAQNGLHTLNHLLDIGRSEPAWHGPVNFVALLILEFALWQMLVVERRRSAGR